MHVNAGVVYEEGVKNYGLVFSEEEGVGTGR